MSAVWYGCVVLLKTVSSDEMLDNLRFMFEGILLRMLGGWLLLACTYWGLLFAFMNGWCFSVFRYSVTSR